MRRLPPVRLAAPPDAVRAAAIDQVGGVALDAHDVRVPVADRALSDVGVDLVLSESDGATVVTLVPHGRLDIPFFRWAFRPLVAVSQRRTARYAIARLRAELEGEAQPTLPKPVIGLPTATFTPEQSTHLATAAAAVAVVSFASALVGQLGGPISHAFNASDATLSNALAVTRVGALIAMVGITLADRRGRRQSILFGIVGSAVVCGVSAFSPNLAFFTIAQVLQRSFLIVTATVATIAVVEEAPEGARAYATSMLALAGGFGFSFSVITLPFADIGRQAWRIPFGLGAALTILLAPAIARRLAETSRYEALAAREDVDRGRMRDIRDGGYGRRFLLLAAVAFLLNVFSAPSSQLTNKYLTDVHQFSNSGIALFRTVTTGIPGLFGLVLGGRLAEVRGRRSVAAIAITIATASQMVFFLTGGVLLWFMAGTSIIAASAGGIALGTLGVELFPTEHRSTSNGLLGVLGVIGSALGFVITGALAHPKGEIGRAIALCGIAALIASVFLVPLLPESHQQQLDDVSPTDARPPEEYGRSS